MPFVRYARDRRGYDTVYVMHAFEGAEKNPRVRVLYACRTVPHAKVGRTSLDEGVQRRIEQAYPTLKFEWPRLLKEAAASAPRPERTDPRANEPRGNGQKRRERKPRAQKQGGAAPQVRFEAPKTIEAPEPLEPITELVEWTSAIEPAEPTEPIEPIEPIEPDLSTLERVGPLMVDPSWPVVAAAGADRALVLRGRYIEIAHRVLSRVSNPSDRARLLRAAARLNPESWKTEEHARAGIAEFEQAFGRLAEQLRQQPPV